MVGRPKNPNSPPKKEPTKRYKVKNLETRGLSYKEPAMINSFWRNHTMEQIQNMSDEELMQEIDQFLDEMIARAIKNDRLWDFPVLKQYLRIASLPNK